MKRFIAIALVFLSIIGIADASYLTYEKFSGKIPVCGESFDCGTVLSSPYASIGPIPLSLLGVLFYFSILIFGCLLVLEQDHLKIRLGTKISFSLKQLLILQASIGFGFSIVLIGIMAFVLEAWCQFCLISAATSTLIFILALLNQHLTKEKI